MHIFTRPLILHFHTRSIVQPPPSRPKLGSHYQWVSTAWVVSCARRPVQSLQRCLRRSTVQQTVFPQTQPLRLIRDVCLAQSCFLLGLISIHLNRKSVTGRGEERGGFPRDKPKGKQCVTGDSGNQTRLLHSTDMDWISDLGWRFFVLFSPFPQPEAKRGRLVWTYCIILALWKSILHTEAQAYMEERWC